MPQRYRRFWLSIPIAVALLIALDVGIGSWHPWPARLPENFSRAYVMRLLDDARRRRPLALLAGDSAIWGYHVSSDDSLGARLAALGPNTSWLNLSSEGGSPLNTFLAVSAALQSGVRPNVVVINVNLKEFSPADRSYNRVLPAFNFAARRLSKTDQADLIFQNGSDGSSLARYVERFWALYRYRLDIKQALFGEPDAATRIGDWVAQLTGRSAREAVLDRPTADKYMATYDLLPIAKTNIALHYTRLLLEELRSAHIPLVAFLTPTNHGLLHDTIDSPDYQRNLDEVAALIRSAGGIVIDLDRMFSESAFIDNDHLRSQAINTLATRLIVPIGVDPV